MALPSECADRGQQDPCMGVDGGCRWWDGRNSWPFRGIAQPTNTLPWGAASRDQIGLPNVVPYVVPRLSAYLRFPRKSLI
jgi:hypothetical protein